MDDSGAVVLRYSALFSHFIKKTTRSVVIKNENKKYTEFDKTFQHLCNNSILLQTYIITSAVNYFPRNVIFV